MYCVTTQDLWDFLLEWTGVQKVSRYAYGCLTLIIIYELFTGQVFSK
jgi:hypothetical protein